MISVKVNVGVRSVGSIRYVSVECEEPLVKKEPKLAAALGKDSGTALKEMRDGTPRRRAKVI